VIHPLSSIQEATFRLDGNRPGLVTDPAFTLSAVLHVVGPLDLDRLGDAADALVARQDVLRTRYPKIGRARLQGVVRHRPRPGRQALTVLPGSDAAVPLTRRADALAATPVPWDEPPVLRVVVEPVGPGEHLVAVVVHHLSVDATSLHLAVAELARNYETPDRPEGPLPLTYGEYAAWQRRRWAARAQADEAAWAEALEGTSPPAYRRDHPFAPGRPTDGRVVRAAILEPADVARLDDWTRRHRSTALATLLAAFVRTLAGETDDEDLLVLTALDQRDHPGAKGLVGSFVHPVLLRLARPADDEPGPVLAARARDAVIAAHGRAQVALDRQLASNPALLAATMGVAPPWLRVLDYLPARGTDRYRLGPASATLLASSGHRVPALDYDLGLRVRRTHAGALVGRLSYDAGELTGAHGRAILDRFRTTLGELVG
jgi:hypothetical protein